MTEIKGIVFAGEIENGKHMWKYKMITRNTELNEHIGFSECFSVETETLIINYQDKRRNQDDVVVESLN